MKVKNKKRLLIVSIILICMLLILLNIVLNKNTKILDINSKMQNYSTSQEEASILNINAFASIEKTEAAKTIYHEGEQFDPTGLIIDVAIQVLMSDGTINSYHDKLYNESEWSTLKNMGGLNLGYTKFRLTNIDMEDCLGETRIPIDIICEYEGITEVAQLNNIDEWNVTVIPRNFTGIKIENFPTKTTYLEGEDFNGEGMQLKGIFENREHILGDEDNEDNSKYKYKVFNGTNLKAEQTSVIITSTAYKDTQYAQTKTIEIPITVTPKQVTNIEITKEPNKKEYIEGQNFDPTGMIVKAIYNNNTTNNNVTNYTVENGNGLKANQTSVTIKYTESGITKRVNQEIRVIQKLYVNITEFLVSTENNISYIEGINPNTTVKELEDRITTNGIVKVYNGINEITNKTTKLATGMNINISFNSDSKEYKIVVIGDLRGTGKMTDADLLKMVRYKAGLDKTLTGEYLRATDLNKNGKYGEDADLLKMARVLARLDNV